MEEPAIQQYYGAYVVQEDAWATLRAYTAARIALGRTGTAIPVKEVLRFKLAHAHARDAVYSSLQTESLQQQLQQLELRALLLHSQAGNRDIYLRHPDKGRALDVSSAAVLRALEQPAVNPAVSVVIADGLSAEAVNNHVYPLLQQLVPMFRASGIQLTPVTIVQQGRVAVGDEVGHLLGAAAVIMLIGERPGLTAADSPGMYLTYQPRPGLTDEARNCISNIHPGGLSYAHAAAKIFYLLNQALQLKLSGVLLKDKAQQGGLEE
jgi:ethanolamine ammonia-lyase small subunit